ncbi:hypothetical protein [Streptomyces sp. FL07-04A]|uniref:hypothetical protein n=1 Tax=Streptomyces sp. FL07-04A TaxID=3028658 RepID=UPI0029A7D1A9|nr:hypothetical protein [Streptomyces sp. FL07-04A]MDX3575616.1 hypothetical protein [Streptomyces sp. FL07-04A]
MVGGAAGAGGALGGKGGSFEFGPGWGRGGKRKQVECSAECGQLGRTDDALAALSVADQQREQLTDGDALPGGMMCIPLEKQLFYASSTHLWLAGRERLGDAEACADEAVEYSRPPRPSAAGSASCPWPVWTSPWPASAETTSTAPPTRSRRPR